MYTVALDDGECALDVSVASVVAIYHFSSSFSCALSAVRPKRVSILYHLCVRREKSIHFSHLENGFVLFCFFSFILLYHCPCNG